MEIETQDQSPDVVDPLLQENLDDVKSSDPLFVKGTYNLEIVKMSQARNKAGTGNMLNVELKTTTEEKAVTGEPIPAGRRLFGRIVLTPTENYPESKVKQTLKKFQECFGTSGAFGALERYVGLQGPVKVGDTKATDDYPEVRSEVKDWVPKKA